MSPRGIQPLGWVQILNPRNTIHETHQNAVCLLPNCNVNNILVLAQGEWLKMLVVISETIVRCALQGFHSMTYHSELIRDGTTISPKLLIWSETAKPNFKPWPLKCCCRAHVSSALWSLTAWLSCLREGSAEAGPMRGCRAVMDAVK